MSEENKGPVLGGGGGDGGVPTDTQEQGSQNGGGEATFTFDDKAYAEFRQTLPEDIRDQPFFTGVKDFSDLASQALHAHKMVGAEKLPAPKDDWTPEQWKDFNSRLGVPEKPDGYGELKLPENLEGLKIDDTALETWDQTFHELGVRPNQREAILTKYAEIKHAEDSAAMESLKTQITEGLGNLQKEWGDDYGANLEVANAALEKVVPEGLMEKITVHPELTNDPEFIKIFYNMGKQMLDDTARTGDSANQGSLFVGTRAQALQSLQAFDDQHKELLFTNPYELTGDRVHLREKREKLLKQRHDLFQKAYPEEN